MQRARRRRRQSRSQAACYRASHRGGRSGASTGAAVPSSTAPQHSRSANVTRWRAHTLRRTHAHAGHGAPTTRESRAVRRARQWRADGSSAQTDSRTRPLTHTRQRARARTCSDPASSGNTTASVCVAATSASSPMHPIRACESSVVNTASTDATCALASGGPERERRHPPPHAPARRAAAARCRHRSYHVGRGRIRRHRRARTCRHGVQTRTAHAELTIHAPSPHPTQISLVRNFAVHTNRFRHTHMSLSATTTPVAMCRARNTAPFTTLYP